MANKYDNGKIYKIVDFTNGNIYIGSTVQTLTERLAQHKRDKRCSSCDIIKNGDYDIILIENYPCQSKEELEARERYYILNTECVNLQIPGRTKKEYYEDNKEKIKKRIKEYRDKNKDRTKEYREKNKDTQSQHQKKTNAYKHSWGGDLRYYNCNLLKIDTDLFS